MHALLRIALVLAGAYAFVCAAAFLLRDRMVFPVRGGSSGHPRDFGMSDGDKVMIPTADGLRIAAWYLPARGTEPGARSGAVLWFHGNAESLEGLGPIIRELRPDSAALLVIDYRGYGESTGSTTPAGTLKDAEAAWDWLSTRPEIDPARIVIYGRSIGSGPATWLAAHRPAAGLVLESAFTSLRAMARVHYPYLPSAIAGGAFDNLALMSQLRCPLLLIHADRDEVAPISMAHELADAHTGLHALWTIHGAGHNETFDAGGEEYRRRFHNFIASTTRAGGEASRP